VAEEFHRRGNYVEALASFQRILENTNWPATNLTYQARMMAGRSAFAAQLWNRAIEHFTALINDIEHSPVELVAEAFFALGDTYMSEDVTAARPPVKKFSEARIAFEKIPQLSLSATNSAAQRLVQRLVPLAWGRIGDCSLQLASQDPKQYANATNAYGEVISHPLADVSTRSLAEYGLGRVLEAEASDTRTAPERADLLRRAFEHYFAILIGQNLRSAEKSDPLWIEKAGFAAARLKETQGEWKIALSVYQRMMDIEALAASRPRLQDKISKARERLGASGD
jgi:tetratricopeptide (TPR) repeat protein